MNNIKYICKILHGSYLYGTNTDKSDFDYKIIYLPSFHDLILNKKINVFRKKNNNLSDTDKMLPGSIEFEYIPLHKFLDDFFNGQTYALECMFAIQQNKFISDNPMVCKNIAYICLNKFCTADLNKMVGYALSQTNKYKIKSQKFKSLETAIKLISQNIHDETSLNKKIKQFPDLIQQLCELDFIQNCEIYNSGGGVELSPAIDICGKKFSLTTTISSILKSLQNTKQYYGERTEFFKDDNIDWKALSHAIRITDQIIEFSSTKNLIFPRHNALLLKQIKYGEISLDDALNYYNSIINKFELIIKNNTNLKEKTLSNQLEFEQWKIHLFYQLYDINQTF